MTYSPKFRLHSKLNTSLESVQRMVSTREFETVSQTRLVKIAMLADVLQNQCKLALDARRHHHSITQTS